ncbi:hypothetical protein BKA63DRAFT_247767 [Paraphoma chrysanthemicola]|nr:hypothetical protein BKA63DRAFT_247767 [Paraphoma chrysanthemicola]
MLFTHILATVFPSVTSSAPLSNPATEPYNCGYVLTQHNSSAYAGIYAYESCEPIYYNTSSGGYQDAYAYWMFGGCGCRFYGLEEECVRDEDAPMYTGPTKGSKAVEFGVVKPRWYVCWELD